MNSKKSIYASPLNRRDDKFEIPLSGSANVSVNFVNLLNPQSDKSYLISSDDINYNKVLDGFSSQLSSSSSIYIIKNRNDLTTLKLISENNLFFDSSILKTMPTLISLEIESSSSVLRLRDVSKNISNLSFSGGQLLGGYNGEKFRSSGISFFELLNTNGFGLSTEEVDDLLIELENYTFTGRKTIRIKGNNAPRSSASASAVSSLESRGVLVDTYVQDNATLTVSPSILTFDRLPSIKSAFVTSNSSWFVFSKPTWVSVSPSSGNLSSTISVSVDENTTGSLRSGDVIIRTSVNSSIQDEITINQGDQIQ